jgi:hypothetical protein
MFTLTYPSKGGNRNSGGNSSSILYETRNADKGFSDQIRTLAIAEEQRRLNTIHTLKNKDLSVTCNDNATCVIDLSN